MNQRSFLTLSFLISLVLLFSSCRTTSDHVVESLDPVLLDREEGVFVMRILTSGVVEENGNKTPEEFADIDYSVRYGTSNSVLGRSFSLSSFDSDYSIPVKGEDRSQLVVRRLPPGEYFLNEINLPGNTQPLSMSARFQVEPGEVTYIGDLCIEFTAKKDWLGVSDYREIRTEVRSDKQASELALAAHFGSTPPALRTSLMEIDEPPVF